MTKIEKIGQLFFPAVFIHDTDEGIREIEQLIRNYKVGGLTFFYSCESVETNFDRKKPVTQHSDSVVTLREMVAHYQSVSEEPLLMSIDAEWGLGMRIASFPAFPYPLTLSAANSEELIFEVGKAIAQELKSVGIHQNLAPVVDININPKNPVIGYRSFGDNRETVTKNAWAYYRGLQSENILGCIKHFPGHGDTAVDSHLGLPILDKSLDNLTKNEIYPFHSLIEKGVDCVMTGHLAAPAISGNQKPTSISKEMIDYLRSQLNYQGAIITDALNMRALASSDKAGEVELNAFMAGNDMLSFSKNIEAGISLIEKNVSEDRIDESIKRIKKLKEKANLFNEKEKVGLVTKETHQPLRVSLAKSVLTTYKSEIKKNINNAALLSIYRKKEESTFASSVKIPTYELTQEEELNNLQEQLSQYESIVVTFYVPSMKPPKNFGIDHFILEFFKQISQEKQVILYLFGNPYTLDLFPVDYIKNIIVAYQYLPELEQVAIQHFNNEMETTGEMPVSKFLTL